MIYQFKRCSVSTAALCYGARRDRRDGAVIKMNVGCKQSRGAGGVEMKSWRVSAAGLAARDTQIYSPASLSSMISWPLLLFPPAGLAIDYFNQRLYWADPELSHIGSMRLDGSDPLVTISARHGKHTNETKCLECFSQSI